jgi:hypothetical protein
MNRVTAKPVEGPPQLRREMSPHGLGDVIFRTRSETQAEANPETKRCYQEVLS